jgi:hypothetical protein
MERRRFLQLLGIGAGGIVLEQAIPFGRVWSFPKNIVIAPQTLRFRVTQRWLVTDGLGYEPLFPTRYIVNAPTTASYPERWLVTDGLGYEPLFPTRYIVNAPTRASRRGS